MLNTAMPIEDVFSPSNASSALSASSACKRAGDINSEIPTNPIRKKKNTIRGRSRWFIRVALEVNGDPRDNSESNHKSALPMIAGSSIQYFISTGLFISRAVFVQIGCKNMRRPLPEGGRRLIKWRLIERKEMQGNFKMEITSGNPQLRRREPTRNICSDIPQYPCAGFK